MPRTPDPRPSNHGGHTPTPVLTPPPLGAGLASRFDWYEATADGLDDGRCAPAIATALGGRVTHARPRNGYSRGEAVVRDDDVLATVHGGSARAGEVHITVTGTSCDDVVPIIRRLWPTHRVSRADSALDFLADFDVLDAEVLEFARLRRLKHSLIRNSDGGATRYVGSRTSVVQVRVYKKSEQLRELHPDRRDEIADGIVRAELVARPGNRVTKDATARLESDDLWGLGEWSQAFAQSVLGVEPARTATHFRRPSDWSRAVHFLGLQYGPSVERRAEDVGAEVALEQICAALGFPGALVVIPGLEAS